ncbi:MAG: hypothetical protein CVU91_13515 [Firmicutes bacterium HGW-Firmicutes-16]|nr:MAG: hypothetical protein CVU91_13515 [Firmicutes bacterium HGW-Firmicutes-16]
MRVTFLIGNGFDINAGLDTRYEDFIKYYHAQPSENNIIDIFKNNLKTDLNKWSDFETTLGKETINPPIDTVDAYNTCVEDFEINLAAYLKLQESRINFEIVGDEIAECMRAALNNFYVRGISKKDQQTLKNNHASHWLSDCIFEFISFNYTNVLDRCIAIAKSKGPLNSRGNVNNPTHPFTDSIGDEVLHIHGTTDEGLILGVNDESQISNTKLLESTKFKHSAIKPIINSNFGSLIDEQAIQVINNSNVICVYGTSLGITDRLWWNSILIWLKSNAHNSLIIFPFVENLRLVLPGNVINKIADIKDQFFNSADATEEEIQQTKDQIFVSIKQVLFDFDTIKVKSSYMSALIKYSQEMSNDELYAVYNYNQQISDVQENNEHSRELVRLSIPMN